MPNSWDDQNLLANLATLGTLAKDQTLDFNQGSGRFAIKKVGFTDTIKPLNDEVSNQIKGLFEHALRYIMTGKSVPGPNGGMPRNVQVAEVDLAKQGVRTLVNYLSTGMTVSQTEEKRMSDLYLDICRLQDKYTVTKEQLIWNKYANECKYQISQRVLIDSGNKGVCGAFVQDWVRRKLAIGCRNGQAKESYATGNNGAKPREGVLTQAEFDRMLKKVNNRIGPLQETNQKLIGELGKPTQPVLTEAATTRFKDNKFTSALTEQPVANYPKEAIDYRAENVNVVLQKFFAELMLTAWFYPFQNKWEDALYHLGWTGKEGALHASHATAMQVKMGGNKVLYFDPNLGEFEFADAYLNRERLYHFLTDVLVDFYKDTMYVKCSLFLIFEKKI
jgi:hypothetical protein